jgi:uncharacterized iron-regulated protein
LYKFDNEKTFLLFLNQNYKFYPSIESENIVEKLKKADIILLPEDHGSSQHRVNHARVIHYLWNENKETHLLTEDGCKLGTGQLEFVDRYIAEKAEYWYEYLPTMKQCLSNRSVLLEQAYIMASFWPLEVKSKQALMAFYKHHEALIEKIATNKQLASQEILERAHRLDVQVYDSLNQKDLNIQKLKSLIVAQTINIWAEAFKKNENIVLESVYIQHTMDRQKSFAYNIVRKFNEKLHSETRVVAVAGYSHLMKTGKTPLIDKSIDAFYNSLEEAQLNFVTLIPKNIAKKIKGISVPKNPEIDIKDDASKKEPIQIPQDSLAGVDQKPSGFEKTLLLQSQARLDMTAGLAFDSKTQKVNAEDIIKRRDGVSNRLLEMRKATYISSDTALRLLYEFTEILKNIKNLEEAHLADPNFGKVSLLDSIALFF